MSDLMLGARDHAHAVLEELSPSAGSEGIAVAQYVQGMQARGVTADDAVSVLQDLIEDAEVTLTDHYRICIG